MRLQLLTGKKFNRWTILGFAKVHKHKSYWYCQCVCGTKRVVRAERLKNGRSKSCGCYHREKVSTNGGRTKHPLYRIWWGIVRRCTKSGTEHYADYGGRGIKLYKKWLKFDAFAAYVLSILGMRPSPQHSIDRKDNEKSYVPGNIRWANPSQQARNKRITKSLTKYSNQELIAEMQRRHLWE